MVKAVIFDMDGVMFDTERIAVDAWIEVLAGMGITAGLEQIRPGIGVNRKDAREIYLRVFGPDFDCDRAIALTGEYQNRWTEEHGVPIKPGLPELLDVLKKSGIKTAVASSTGEKRVRRLLELAGISNSFDAVVCGDMVEHSKPEPEIFLKTAQLLETAPEDCVVLEDSPNGIRAGWRAGMKVIMIPDLIEPDETARLCAAIAPSLRDAQRLIFEGNI